MSASVGPLSAGSGLLARMVRRQTCHTQNNIRSRPTWFGLYYEKFSCFDLSSYSLRRTGHGLCQCCRMENRSSLRMVERSVYFFNFYYYHSHSPVIVKCVSIKYSKFSSFSLGVTNARIYISRRSSRGEFVFRFCYPPDPFSASCAISQLLWCFFFFFLLLTIVFFLLVFICFVHKSVKS